jgi:hypothetical protein
MISFSNKTPGLVLSSQSCPRMERPISPIPRTGPTSLLERDISCATLRDPLSVPAAHSRHLYQGSALLDSPMAWKVTAQRLQRLRLLQGRQLKVFQPAHHYKWPSTGSPTATLHTQEKGSLLASATSPTSPARALSMHRYQQKRLFKKQTMRPTTMGLSWPGIYQACTPNTQPHINHLIQANHIDTPMQQRAVLIKTCTRIMVSDRRRDRTGRQRLR